MVRESASFRVSGAASRIGRSHSRIGLLTFLSVLLNVWLGSIFSNAQAQSLSGMTDADVKLLQQRLIDAGCYKGNPDGVANEALRAARAACPDQEPILRIETGMHLASIREIGVDDSCHIAATGSEDKTVRLWSMPDGKLIRTLRLPIGAGVSGKIFAAAVSPDGNLVAAGGWDAHSIENAKFSLYLFDAARDAPPRRIGSFEEVISHLAFSRDGRWLAVGLMSKRGVRVVDVQTGNELFADRDYADSVFGLSFAPSGILYAVGLDGFLRRYDVAAKSKLEKKTPGTGQPYSVAVDPSGKRLAVGYVDRGAADIVDAADLHLLHSTDAAGIDNRGLGAVAWSSDGEHLFGAGEYGQTVDGKFGVYIRSWNADGRRTRKDALVSGNAVTSLATCGPGVAFASADPAFGLETSDGKPGAIRESPSADMRGKTRDAFMVSADAARVRFGLGLGSTGPVLFDIANATLTDSPSAPSDLSAPRIDGLDVANWFNSTRPLFAGRLLPLGAYEAARSLAIRSDNNGFVLGGSTRLRTFDSAGKQIWERSVPSEAYGVNLSQNGAVIVAAYGDGTIHWQRWSNSQELLTLFVDAQTRTWVAWTPGGYYMASPGGEDLIGWQVNRGWEQQADFFPAARFRDRFNRPDIVRLVLETLDEGEAVKRANEAGRRREDSSSIIARLPPVVMILSPRDGDHFSGDTIALEYAVRSPSNLPIDGVEVLIDGRPARSETFKADDGVGENRRKLTIPVPAHDVVVSLFAHIGEIAGEAARVKLTYDGVRPPNSNLLEPSLYVLAIGVSNYARADLRLRYPAGDARSFAEEVQRQKGGLYSNVGVRLLVDEDATREGVIDGLEWLGREVTSRDLAILFLAGHGLTDERLNYWYLPVDATPDRLGATAVSQDDIRRSLAAVAGKVVLFLDTCSTGSALRGGGRARGPIDIDSVINDFAKTENGLVVFSASSGRENSCENDARGNEWGHSAFAMALIEGISGGKADLLHSGVFSVSELDAYVSERVKELTQGRQHPVMTRPISVPDFPIGVLR
jgi:hypothetical protein